MPDNKQDVIGSVMNALEVLQEAKTVVDTLNIAGALTLSLAEKSLSPGKYWALSLFNVEAAKKIKEIAQSEQ